MVVNMNMRSSKEGSINEYLSDTIASVFPEVYTAEVERYTNRCLYASFNKDILDRMRRNNEIEPSDELRSLIARVDGRLIPYEGGVHIMTDDKAPVELLGMRVIDEIIQDEVAYYKGIFKEGGLKALLESW
jgi:hypothetical protein